MRLHLGSNAKIDAGRRPTLRIAVGLHLAAVCVCAANAYLDGPGGRYPGHEAPKLFFGLLLLPSVLAWPACPFVVLVTAHRRGLSWPVADAIVAEAVLCVGQIFVLMPLIQ